jgi:hypothetical protein
VPAMPVYLAPDVRRGDNTGVSTGSISNMSIGEPSVPVEALAWPWLCSRIAVRDERGLPFEVEYERGRTGEGGPLEVGVDGL